MDYEDANLVDSSFGPLGSPGSGHAVGPLDSLEAPPYADTQMLAFLSNTMRGATTRFLQVARAKGHRVQPIPSAHVDPYQARQKASKRKPFVLSREAIRIVFFGGDGTLLESTKVPRTAWVDLADIASQCGLAPGLKAPHGDPTYFALHQGTTVHGATHDVAIHQPWRVALRRIPNGTVNGNTFKFAHGTLELAHQPLEVVVEQNIMKLRLILLDKAVYQLTAQAEHLCAEGAPEATVARWYTRAEKIVEAEIGKKDLSMVFREVTRIVYGKKASAKATASDKEAKNLENELSETSTKLTEEKEEKAIESGEKLGGIMKVAGFPLTRLEIICGPDDISVKLIEKPKHWPRLAVLEELEKGAAMAASMGIGLAGGDVGAELGSTMGRQSPVWAFGPAGQPGASVGTLVGGILGAWGGGTAAREVSSKHAEASTSVTDAVAREVEKVFPVNDTSLTLQNEGGVRLTK